MKKIITDKRGFTLIETMIAISFFAIAMLGGSALYIRSSMANKTGNIVSSANFLAKTTLEGYKNLSLDDLANIVGNKTDAEINETGDGSGIFTRQVVITPIDLDSSSRASAYNVKITITWPNAVWAVSKGKNSDRVELVSNVRGDGL